ncbi:MAG: hypothetical protein ABEJ43_06845 [Haloferacaceae archaeon]
MPSTATDPTPVDVPPDAAAVARRYLRLERPATAAVTLLAAVAGAAAVLSLALAPALAVVVGIVAALRAPLFRKRGSATLRTDADAETVRADFEGATPPPLAIQWGVADAVSRTDDGARYEVSYLFGLQSQTLAVERARPSNADVELVVTADEEPWATYTATVAEQDGETRVSVAWVSDRRFGLRRLPQELVARRYRDAALAAQGYEVEARDGGIVR